MKYRNREINIFSMSALDLFASALGAFILISLVVLPFFPNLSAVKNKKQLPNLDIVVAVDITVSMGSVIVGLKGEIDSIASILEKIAPSVGIGIVVFGDKQYQTPTQEKRITEITKNQSNFDDLKKWIDDMEPGMGTGIGSNPKGGPEAIDLAMEKAVNDDIGWRSDAQTQIIILITDQPAYRDKQDYVIRLVSNFSSKPERSVSTVNYGDSGSEAAEFLKKVAKAGKGTATEKGGSITATLLKSIL